MKETKVPGWYDLESYEIDYLKSVHEVLERERRELAEVRVHQFVPTVGIVRNIKGE